MVWVNGVPVSPLCRQRCNSETCHGSHLDYRTLPYAQAATGEIAVAVLNCVAR